MTALQTPIELACGLEDCEIMESTIASALAVGTPVVLGSGYVFSAMESVAAVTEVTGGASEKTVAVIAKAKNILAKKADTVTFTAFAPVYYDVSEGKVTSTADSNILIGYTNKPAVAADTSVHCTFDGYAQAQRVINDIVEALE